MITKSSKIVYYLINNNKNNNKTRGEDSISELKLGQKIKKIRIAKKLRLADVSEMTGLSKSHISQIENHKISPSVSAIARIGKALGISLSTLFGEMESDTDYLIKKGERKVFTVKASGIKYELLTSNFKENLMGAAYITIKPGGSTGKELHAFEGEQFGFLLKGRLEINLNGEKIIMEEGDSIYFKSSIPHSGRNVGDCEVEAIWVVTSPDF